MEPTAATSIMSFNPNELVYILPEGILAVGVLALLLLSTLGFKKTREENDAMLTTSLVFFTASFLALVWTFFKFNGMASHPILNSTITIDPFGFLIRGMLMAGGFLTLSMSKRYLEMTTHVVGDFYALVTGATLGGLFLASSTDLIALFVSLETLSITSYILAGYLRKTVDGAEASFKYLIYGGMGTAILLFGLSLVYGLSQSTQFADISSAIAALNGVSHPTLILMVLMVFAALAYKLSVAPFHMWAPDVYDGAPSPIAAFLSVVSKTAAFAITIRLFAILWPGFSGWAGLMGALSVLSMTLGNVVALKQTRLKRLLAYSTVAHAGYMLLGLMVSTQINPQGVGSLVYYLMTYVFMNLGAFASVIFINLLTGSDEIKAVSGLVQKRPGLVFGFSICLLSLAGIPITSGFFAKFFLFQSVVANNPQFLWMVGIALINSTISLAYYLNIIRLMVVKEPSPEVAAISERYKTPVSLTTALAFNVILTLALGIFASPFYDFSVQSVRQLFSQQPVIVGQK